MSFSFQVNAENGIVRINGVGEISAQGGTEITEQSLKCARENGLRLFLYDFRQMKVTESIFSLYERPRKARGMGAPPDARVAMLCLQPDTKLEFLETTANNQGFLFRIFTDESQAIEWLKGE